MKYGNWTLGQTEALINAVGGLEIAMRLISGVAKVVIETVKRLIKTGDTDEILAMEGLVITEEFLRDRCNIKFLGDNFRRLVLGKKLAAVKARKLGVHKPQEWVTTQQIAQELGAHEPNFFLYLLALVEKQKNGESGTLLTDGYSTLVIVEIEEPDGKGGVVKNPWAVFVRWNSVRRFWYAGAYPAEYEWDSVVRFLS